MQCQWGGFPAAVVRTNRRCPPLWTVSRSVLQWPIEHPWAACAHAVQTCPSLPRHPSSPTPSPLLLGIHPMTKFFQSLKRKKDRWNGSMTAHGVVSWRSTFSAVRRFLLDLSVFVVVVVVNKHSLQLRLRLQESNYCILLVSFYCFRLIVSESDCCVSN